MSVEITQVTVNSILDKRLTLKNSQWAAKLDIGSDWTRLRIGMRFSFSDLGINVFGTPRLFLGVMSNPSAGLVNGPLGDTTSHFIGYRSNTAQWTRNADPSFYYTTDTIGAGCKKIDGTSTIISLGIDSIWNSYQPDDNMNVMMVELRKESSISTLLSYLYPDLSGDTGSFELEDIRGAMEIDTLLGARDHLNALSGPFSDGRVEASVSLTQLLATNEVADGAWDSIVVAWNRSNPILYVSEMLFAKME